MFTLKRLATCLLWLALALAPAIAANTSISNGESGASVRAKSNTQLLQQFNVMQPPYSAANDSTTDDTAAIQAAINDAISAGGWTVYLPAGAGTGHCYKITQPLVFTGGTGSGSRYITLKGEKGTDINGSRLCAQFGGLSTNVTGAANNGSGKVRLAVTSTTGFHGDSGGAGDGDLVYVAGVTGATGANGYFGITVIDGTHVDLLGSTFGGAYVSGGAMQLPGYVIDHPDGLGIQNLGKITQLEIQNSHPAGGGVRWGGTGPGTISDCAVSTGMVGVNLSTNSYNVTMQGCVITGSSTASEYGMVGVVATQSILIGNSFTRWSFGVRARNVGTVIQGNRFEVNYFGLVLGQAFDGSTIAISGAFITANSTERNYQAFTTRSATGTLIAGNVITGIVGPPTSTSAATWAAGTATLTSLSAHGLSGVRPCIIEGFVNQPGYNGSYSCTFSSTNTITYPLVSNPGTPATAQGTWSLEVQYGIQHCNGAGVAYVANAVTASPIEQAGIDLDCAGNAGSANVSFLSTTSGSWNYGGATGKAGFTFVGATNNNPALGMHFADLPGQAGVGVATAIAGMTYFIVDANQATLGGAVTAGGAPNTNGYVTYNGSGWTLSSK